MKTFSTRLTKIKVIGGEYLQFQFKDQYGDSRADGIGKYMLLGRNRADAKRKGAGK